MGDDYCSEKGVVNIVLDVENIDIAYENIIKVNIMQVSYFNIFSIIKIIQYILDLIFEKYWLW